MFARFRRPDEPALPVTHMTAMRRSAALILAVAFASTLGCDMRFGSGSYVPPPPPPDPTDPPSRVARLSYLEGPASVQPAGVERWWPAEVNRPLVVGDGLWTDRGARAEIDFGFAVLRMDSRTSLDFLALDDSGVQAGMTQGVITIHVRRLAEGDSFEIDTPNVSITPSIAGDYRVEVYPETNSTEVIARSGRAEVTGPKRAFEVTAGQCAHVKPSRRGTHRITAAEPPDAFDQFARFRDLREGQSESAKHVSPGVVGYYDLDEFGIWLTHPAWGAYWTPRRVPAGWVPYRFGHWTWIEPWGWNWIDDAPWGFAPSHYGRWTRVDGAWSWIPGPSDKRPVYAPALVAFVGSGAGMAWFPLAPGEVYVPAYRCSRRYVMDLNGSGTALETPTATPDVDMLRQTYANRSAALTAASCEAFTTGQPIGPAATIAMARDAASWKVTGPTAAVAPTLESLGPAFDAGVRVPQPPASAEKPVILRGTPPPPPVPFERRRAALEEHPGQPLDRETLDLLRRSRAK